LNLGPTDLQVSLGVYVDTQTQLGNILRQFMQYYNNQRPHMGIGGQIPCRQGPPETSDAICKTPVLGGLHNHYFRRVA
jgi:hypothetical protein